MKNIIVNAIVVFFVFLTGSTNSQWFIQGSLSQEYYLNDVFVIDQNNVFDVGFNQSAA